jgi:hypothetical protein
MMSNKQHLTEEGLRHIIDIVFDTPQKKGGERLYTKEELLSVLGNPSKAAALSKSKKKTRAELGPAQL